MVSSILRGVYCAVVIQFFRVQKRVKYVQTDHDINNIISMLKKMYTWPVENIDVSRKYIAVCLVTSYTGLDFIIGQEV